MMYQTTPSPRILILLIHLDIQPSVSESSSGGRPTDTSTDHDGLLSKPRRFWHNDEPSLREAEREKDGEHRSSTKFRRVDLEIVASGDFAERPH